MSAGKRKREDFPAQYHNGGYNIPQQDGAGDAMSEIFELEVCFPSPLLIYALLCFSKSNRQMGAGAAGCFSKQTELYIF